MVRTRFAPSPTGSLHVGNARMAVLNWLFARHHDGAFVLRIEDTDRERLVAGAEAGILEDLRWLGLDWDEGPGVEGPAGEGPHAPYRQSERGAIYRDHAQRLVDAGLAYPCYCTPEEIEAAREAAIARGEKPHYAGTCRRLTRDDVARHTRAGRRPALRFRVPTEGEIVVHDVVRGAVRFDASDVGDFIVLRSDGMPTYNFAVVVDDALMEITHVIRGVGHLSNTPRQLLLYEALGFPVPTFAHAPTVLGPDRQKLSKRHGAKALADYRREGWHPDAIVNYLSLLGWSSPSGDEFLLRQRLVTEISLERIRATDVVFDPDKLRWLSSKHIERMSTAELADALDGFIDRERYPLAEDALPVVVEAVRSHLSTLSEINDHLDPFVPTLDAEGAARRDALRGDDGARRVLRAVRARLARLDAWDDAAIDAAVREAGREVGARGRALFEPLRIALTGREHGPPLAKVAVVLGRASVLDLLDAAGADEREV
ncbi:MAG TPA: glutamate--tRNA ligase [Longimicrobiales bacterium]